MPIKFKPVFTITTKIAHSLAEIESSKKHILQLPITSAAIISLRESARLFSTHYSTFIEGNRLTHEQVAEIVEHKGHFPGREREEYEVKGYYDALAQVEKWTLSPSTITEASIKTLHALVIGHGKIKVHPTGYREGQNVIRDSASKQIIYMPPEASDVPILMKSLIDWMHITDLPCPIVAAIIHYQFATIHPYYDGNGRTARLLTTLVLHKGGYDLKGLYALEEYYARNLAAYYSALTVGPSHNYYMGRADADITQWIEYFLEGMAHACSKVLLHIETAHKSFKIGRSPLLKMLDPKQRKALELFTDTNTITASQLGMLFKFKPRTCSKLCADWVSEGFLEIVNPARKNRTYQLGKRFKTLFE